MKKFSDLRRKLSEDSEAPYAANFRVNPIGGNNEVDQADVAIFDVARPDSINRINTYLGAAKSKPVIDPHSVLRQIQRKLSIIGLQFSIPTKDLSSIAGASRDSVPAVSGQMESKTVRDYPLTYLGGRFGVLDDNYNIGFDDNISHRLGHGLMLRVEYVVQESGMTLVVPRIVPRTNQSTTPKPSPTKHKKITGTTPGQK